MPDNSHRPHLYQSMGAIRYSPITKDNRDLRIISVRAYAINPNPKKLMTSISQGLIFGQYANDKYSSGEWNKYIPILFLLMARITIFDLFGVIR